MLLRGSKRPPPAGGLDAKRSRVDDVDAADPPADDEVSESTCVQGMLAHNRRIATRWPIAAAAGPAAVRKMSVSAAAVGQLYAYLEKHWRDGASVQTRCSVEGPVCVAR